MEMPGQDNYRLKGKVFRSGNGKIRCLDLMVSAADICLTARIYLSSEEFGAQGQMNISILHSMGKRHIDERTIRSIDVALGYRISALRAPSCVAYEQITCSEIERIIQSQKISSG